MYPAWRASDTSPFCRTSALFGTYRLLVRFSTPLCLAVGTALVLGASLGAVARTAEPHVSHPAAAVQAQAPARTVPAPSKPSILAPAKSAPPKQVAAPPAAPKVAWVAVPAATIWRRTTDVRRIDRVVLGPHPNVSRWLRSQSVVDQRGMDIGVMTEAILGEQVHVLTSHRGWSQVRVDDQTGSAYPLGIIGWVPTVQLGWRAPTRPAYPVTVKQPTGAALVSAARGLLGVPYLWGGLTRSGIDCSGLVYLVFRQMGVTLPRDAADQARFGRSVARGQLKPGDLVFLSPGARSAIHHVGIYLGNGLVLHAPRAGTSVTITRLATWTDYWGARRLLPA